MHRNVCPAACFYILMKNLLRIISALALVIRVTGLPLAARAADPVPEAPKAEKKSKATKTAPFTGKVGAVDKLAKTVTLEGKDRQRVFQITSETRIFKEKKPGIFADVQVGDTVGGSARESNDGKMEALTLNVLPAKQSKPKEGEKKVSE
jgi:hypothetical protein